MYDFKKAPVLKSLFNKYFYKRDSDTGAFQ